MDDVDFTALAARTSAGLDDVRCCLLVSPDGLTLGAYPEAKEGVGRDAWARLQTLGDPHRGFLDLGSEVWAMARRGPYAALLIAGPGSKPGLMLDKLEVLLRSAEEARSRESAAAQSKAEIPRRPRTSLHKEPKVEPAAEKKPEPKVAEKAEERKPDPARLRQAVGPKYSPPEELTGAARRVVDVGEASGSPTPQAQGGPPLAQPPAQTPQAPGMMAPPPAQPAGGPAGPAPSPGPEPAEEPKPASRGPAEGGSPPDPPSDTEVDRVALAREFGKLFTEGEDV